MLALPTDGDYKIHLFNSPGTFTVNNNALGTVDYVIIAGGGDGGALNLEGTGGFRTNFPQEGYCGGAQTLKELTLVAGAGGTGKCSGSSSWTRN